MASPYNRRVLAETIQKAREGQGLTQAQLAGLMELGQQAVSKWESGETRPRPGHIPRLEQFLLLPPGALLRLSGYINVDDYDAALAEMEEAQRAMAAAGKRLEAEESEENAAAFRAAQERAGRSAARVIALEQQAEQHDAADYNSRIPQVSDETRRAIDLLIEADEARRAR